MLIQTHQINPLNKAITVEAVGEPGAGGAHQTYHISFFDAEGKGHQTVLQFQEGDPNVVGPTGITNEVLLVILEHRLKGFDEGRFRCRENSIALTHTQTARLFLQQRTLERIARGVEGQQVQ